MLGHCVLALVLVAPAIMADYVPGKIYFIYRVFRYINSYTHTLLCLN